MESVSRVVPPREQTVQELRTFSRRLVRELGFMRGTLAGSGLAPSAVHALLEIGAAPGIQARDLAGRLRLDKSNTSRQLARLEADGLVARRPAHGDGRATELFLTTAGQRQRGKIDRFAAGQVADALQRLSADEQQALVHSLALYSEALAHGRGGAAQAPEPAPDRVGGRIVEGYRPGCIGDVASAHARFYARQAGFGLFFENKVAAELAAFCGTLPAPGKALWLYVEGGRTLASLAIDGDADKRIAHLRWFIVDESLRGSGIGRRLLARAMAFVDRHADETALWTFRGLDAARHLYESVGFRLTHEAEGTQWGAAVVEQRFDRPSKARRR